MMDKIKRRWSKNGSWIDIAVSALSQGIRHSDFIREHANHPLVSGIMANVTVDPSFTPCGYDSYARKQRIAARNHKKRPNYRYRRAA